MSVDEEEPDNWIAVIGSHNTLTEFHVDIAEQHIDRPLAGGVFYFRHKEGGKDKIAIAQMVALESINKWHEDATMKALITKYGGLKYISGVTDTKSGVLSLIGAFEQTDRGYTKTVLNTPPLSGTKVYPITEELLRELVQRENPWFVGYFYGSRCPAPLVVPSFAELGEAYHYGIFGKTGCGKSVIAAELILGFARHHDMGILVIDPQGEFYDNKFADKPGYPLDFLGTLRKIRRNRDVKTVNLLYVQLEGWSLFLSLLKKCRFFKHLGIKKGEIQDELIDILVSAFSGKKVEEATLDEVLEKIKEKISRVYKSKSSIPTIDAYYNDKKQLIDDIWNKIHGLFTRYTTFGKPKETLEDIISSVIIDHAVVILDVDKISTHLTQVVRGVSGEDIKVIMLNTIIKKIKYVIRRRFRENVKGNALIVFDEAHLYIPQSTNNEGIKELRGRLVEAVRMTRKYGIGWMFITTTIADTAKEIYKQLTVRIFGYGLSVGADAEHLKDTVGNEAFEVYRSLPDPKQTNKYTFLLSGHISAIGTLGTPTVIEMFESPDVFYEKNKLNEPPRRSWDDF